MNSWPHFKENRKEITINGSLIVPRLNENIHQIIEPAIRNFPVLRIQLDYISNYIVLFFSDYFRL